MRKADLVVRQAHPRRCDLLFHPSGIAQCKLIQLRLHQRIIVNCKLCTCRRRRRTQICNKIGDCRIRFMTDCGNNRNAAVKNRLCDNLFIKCPEVFNGTAATPDNHHIDLAAFQRPYSVDNARRRLLSLHDRRIQDNLHVWIASRRNVDNIAHCSPSRRSHNAERPDKTWNRLFIFRRKQPLLRQFPLELFKTLIQLPCPVERNRLCIQLISAVPFKHVDRPSDDNLLSFLHMKFQSAPVAGKHNTGNCALSILQGKINMP